MPNIADLFSVGQLQFLEALVKAGIYGDTIDEVIYFLVIDGLEKRRALGVNNENDNTGLHRF